MGEKPDIEIESYLIVDEARWAFSPSLRRFFAKIRVGECYGDVSPIDRLVRRYAFPMLLLLAVLFVSGIH
jgi:hypothetical protein